MCILISYAICTPPPLKKCAYIFIYEKFILIYIDRYTDIKNRLTFSVTGTCIELILQSFKLIYIQNHAAADLPHCTSIFSLTCSLGSFVLVEIQFCNFLSTWFQILKFLYVRSSFRATSIPFLGV